MVEQGRQAYQNAGAGHLGRADSSRTPWASDVRITSGHRRCVQHRSVCAEQMSQHPFDHVAGAIAQYTSFTTPIFLKLCFDNGSFQRGPWHLGKFSKPLNACACIWWLVIVPALCFPPLKGTNLTLLTMNWTCLIYGGAMSLAMGWYFLSARKWFKGPRINVTYVEGEDPQSPSSSGSGDGRREKS